MENNQNKLSRIDRYTTLVIVLGPMFTQYASVFNLVLLPELFVIPLLLLSLFKSKYLMIQNFRRYFLYLAVVLFLTLINVLIGTNVNLIVAISAFIRHFFYAIVIISIGYKNFNIDFGAKVLLIVALINSIYGVLQFIFFHTFGKILPWYFSFLNTRYGTNLIENQTYYFENFGYRFSGLFSEPAHFSQYIAIALVVTLFYKSNTFKMKKLTMTWLTLIFSFVLLLNGSGTGFAMILFITVIFFVNAKSKNLSSLMLKYSLVAIVSVVLLFISKNESLNLGLERIMSTSELSTSNIRIFRPFNIFSHLPFLNKIIGVGYANYSEYVINSNLASNFELSIKSAWTNTIGYILVGSGAIGMFFYLNFYVHLLIRTKYFYRYLVLLLGVFSLFTEVPLSFQFITIMSFVLKGVTTQNL